MQQAVDSVPPGSTVVVRTGTYRERLVITRPVRLVGVGVSIDLPGPPTAFPDEASDDTSAVVEIRDTSGVEIERLTVTGPYDGFAIHNSSDVVLDGVDARRNGDDGVHVLDSSAVELVDNSVTASGAYGIHITNASDTVLAGNNFMQNTLGDVRED